MLRCAERDSYGQASRLKEAGVRCFTTILGCSPELPLVDPEVLWLSPWHGGRWRRNERKEERKGDWCRMQKEAVEVWIEEGAIVSGTRSV